MLKSPYDLPGPTDDRSCPALLLQPPPEVFNVFDDLIIMAEGWVPACYNLPGPVGHIRICLGCRGVGGALIIMAEGWVPACYSLPGPVGHIRICLGCRGEGGALIVVAEGWVPACYSLPPP